MSSPTARHPSIAPDLHDHGVSAASFSVVCGELAEVRVSRSGLTANHTWHPGCITWLAPGAVHDVSGAGAGPAVSVHTYSPPLEQMTYYDLHTTAGLRVVRSVRTEEPEEAAK